MFQVFLALFYFVLFLVRGFQLHNKKGAACSRIMAHALIEDKEGFIRWQSRTLFSLSGVFLLLAAAMYFHTGYRIVIGLLVVLITIFCFMLMGNWRYSGHIWLNW